MRTRIFIFITFLFYICLPILISLGGIFFILNEQTWILNPAIVCVLFLGFAYVTPYFGFSGLYVYSLAVRLKPRADGPPPSYLETFKEALKTAKLIGGEIKLSKSRLKNARNLLLLLIHNSSPIDYPALYVICWFVQENETQPYLHVMLKFLFTRRDTEFQSLAHKSHARWTRFLRFAVPLLVLLGIIGIWTYFFQLVLFPVALFVLMSLFSKLFLWPVWVKKGHLAVDILREPSITPSNKTLKLLESGFKLW